MWNECFDVQTGISETKILQCDFSAFDNTIQRERSVEREVIMNTKQRPSKNCLPSVGVKIVSKHLSFGIFLQRAGVHRGIHWQVGHLFDQACHDIIKFLTIQDYRISD